MRRHIRTTIALISYLAFQLSSFTVSAATFEAFQLKKIQIEGLQKISRDAVLQELPFQVGATLHPEDTAALIRALYKTGFFKDIRLDHKDHTLIIHVTERPSIGGFELTGIRGQEEVKKILKEHQVIEGWMYDPARLKKAEEAIEHHYLSKGRYGVRIDTKVTDQPRNRVAIKMAIYEGDEARVKQVKIVGNKIFSEKTLIKQMHHGSSNWFSWYTKNDRYSKEKLEADLEILRSYYMDRGYINFQVDSTQISLSPNRKDLYLTINVTEGQLHRFGPIRLAGTFVIPQKEIQKLVDEHLKEGKVFSRREIWEAKKAIEERYGEEGYSEADVRINMEPNEKKKIIPVEFFIEPSKRMMVRWIRFEGNTLTQDEVLRRGNAQMEGAWISTKDIREGKEYMLRNGYVGQADVRTEPVPGHEDQVDVYYTVEEKRGAQVTAGIAYSATDRFMLNLGADLKNFLGTGRDVSFAFNNSKTFRTYSLGYYNPYFTSEGIGMGYNLYYHKNNFSETAAIFDYTTNSLGGDVNWSVPLSQYDSVTFAAGVDRSRLVFPWDAVLNATDRELAKTNLGPREILEFIQREGQQFHEYTLSLGWRHNSLDRFIFPTRGIKQNVVSKVALPNSSLKYYQLTHEVSYFHPIYEEHIFNVNTNVGYSDKYGSTFKMPFFKHFFAGGADSVRGFRTRSLGPRDSKNNVYGGNILVYGNLSYIFPCPAVQFEKVVRTALFLDAGQVYDIRSSNPHGLRYSLGLSLTWNSPLGIPLVFSIAEPLNLKPGERRHAFDFTFGTQFL